MNKENTQITSEDFSIYNGEGTILRKAQLTMLEIVEVFDSICKKNNILYWLDYGTLLGAVRHKGFIPWDDDLDVSVPLKYYKKLRQALIEELPDHLIYQDWIHEQKYTFKHGKIRHKFSYFDEGLSEKDEMEFQGIFIDIFPVREVFAPNLKNLIGSIYGRSFRRIRHLTDSKIEHFIGLLIWPFGYSLVLIYRFLNLFFKRNYITNIFGGVYNKNFYKKDLIYPLKKIEFEGKTFSAPNQVEEYLTYVYGDFMKIPSPENRVVHAERIEFIEEKE